MALPATSSAQSCAFVGGGLVAVYGSAVDVGPGANDPGAHGAFVGVCVDTNTVVDGGYAEVGQGASYGVIDASGASPYAGFNNGGVSEGDPDDSCNGVDEDQPAAGHDGPDKNSGGCFWIRPPVGSGIDATNPVTAMFVCGNRDWSQSTGDGCSIP